MYMLFNLNHFKWAFKKYSFRNALWDDRCNTLKKIRNKQRKVYLYLVKNGFLFEITLRKDRKVIDNCLVFKIMSTAKLHVRVTFRIKLHIVARYCTSWEYIFFSLQCILFY